MSLPAAASGFVVLLLSVQVIQGQDGWGVTYRPAEICALKGSTVKIRCSYTYPYWINGRYTRVQETIWFIQIQDDEPVDVKTDPEYSDRVRYSCDRKACILRITDLRESDSAEYKFRFITNQPGRKYTGSPGVNLTVTVPDLQVKVRRSYSTRLECHNRCVPPDDSSYIWYKNGEKILEDQSTSYSVSLNYADSYSCAVKGYEDFPSPPVCVSGLNCNRVIYTDRSICAFKGSSVDISCMYNGYQSITSKFWFRSERSRLWQNTSNPEDLKEDSQYGGRVQVLETERGRSTLRITDLRETDSAQYHFRFKTGSFEWRSSLPGTTLTVTVPDLQVKVSRSSSTRLECHSSCVPPDDSSYIWYKNGEKISEGRSSSYSVSWSNADSYSCAVKGYEDFPSPPVCVDGQNCNRVIYTDRSICAFKGSSVDISCMYNGYQSITSKFWFRSERSGLWQNPSHPEDLKEDSQYGGRVQVLETERGRSTLRITDLRETDSAQYHFRFKTGSFEWRSSLPGTTLTVTGLQVQVTRINVDQLFTHAELKCDSSCSPAVRLSYVWFKNGEIIRGVEASSHQYRLSLGDSISCAVKGHETFPSPPVYAPKLPSVSVSPSAEVEEGSSVTLTCSSDANPAANYTWYKENLNLKPLREEPQLVFSSIQSSDSGQYYCTAENKLGKTSKYIFIDVKYAPKLPSVSVSPSAEVEEGSSVTLTCSSDANPAASYTWYKENLNVKPLSEEPQLVFSSIRSSDSGRYNCTAENELGKTSKYIFIDVKYAPKLPFVSVSPSAEVEEGSSVTLSCSSDASPAASYTWYKENLNLKPLSEEPQLVFSSIQSSDSGRYNCTAENELGKTSKYIFIDVKYAPKLPSVSVSPSAEVEEGSSVTLTCSSNANPAASYTWYKENLNLKPLSEEPQLVFSSIQSSDSGRYNCTAENELGKTSKYIFIDVKYAPKLPSVSVSPSAEVEEGSSVTLTCSSGANPAASYTWYKENLNVKPLSEEPQLVFSSIRSSDSGRYNCTAENELGKTSKYIFIGVKYGPKLPSVSVSPSAEVEEGSSVTMTCSSDANPAASYTWYKDNLNLKPLSEEPQLVFSSIQSSDSGQYNCTAENELGKRTSEYISIDVKYSPKLPSVSVSPSAEIEEGSSVTLICSSDANPAASYTWYKDNLNLKPLSEEPQLVFSSIQSSDSGQYNCTTENKFGKTSKYIFIDVKYGPKLPSVSVSPSAEVEEGSSVTMTCSSDANPAASYTWYKENLNLKPLSEEPQLVFSSIQLSDSGQYNCTAENELGKRTSEYIFIDVKYAPKLPSVSVSPSAEVEEGSSVTVTCSSDANPAASYTWYKENLNLKPLSEEPQLVFSSIQSSDSGQYNCTAENELGKRTSEYIFIDVTYAPKLPSVSVSPSAEVEEGSSVNLTCSSDANPAANYTWYKENEDSPKASGQIFTITDFRPEHSGSYYCEAQNRRGRHSNTVYLTVGADKSTMIISVIGSTLVVTLISLSLCCLWMRPTAEPNESIETLELDTCPLHENITAAETDDTEKQEDLV